MLKNQSVSDFQNFTIYYDKIITNEFIEKKVSKVSLNRHVNNPKIYVWERKIFK